ncbi:unnamed protein product [marine sediment metagenome]|uniref:Uncharacterized protein n=1 Tax=marine sediment metagenome TaxID=412755 RepID=X1N966_9ZZZZ
MVLFGSGVKVGRTGVSVHRSAPWGAINIGSVEVNDGNEHDKVQQDYNIISPSGKIAQIG